MPADVLRQNLEVSLLAHVQGDVLADEHKGKLGEEVSEETDNSDVDEVEHVSVDGLAHLFEVLNHHSEQGQGECQTKEGQRQSHRNVADGANDHINDWLVVSVKSFQERLKLFVRVLH